jgi:putative NIF3 family GTP cyclohydrolase 1 type 2
MSKRDLKKYVTELKKEQLEEQLIELYEKFKEVKVYYDFVFNPNENKLVDEAKTKISNEYFPIKGRRPKMRRSVAQKYIKHYMSLGVDIFLVGDLLLYNIEIAQAFSSEKVIKQELFFKSMLTSFQQAISFLIKNGILEEFKSRVVAIKEKAILQNWLNQYEFNALIERFEY